MNTDKAGQQAGASKCVWDWRCLVVHPLLFAAWPVILSAELVKYEVLPVDIIFAVALFEALAMIIWPLLWLLFRDWRKSGLACSIVLIGCFLFRIFYSTSQSLFGLPSQDWVPASLAWLYLLIYALVIAGLVRIFTRPAMVGFKGRLPIDQKALASALNLVSLVLVLLNLVPLVAFEFNYNRESRQFRESMQRQFQSVALARSTVKPDIYYIILDGYPHALTLSDFGYDNSSLISFLKDRGFYVVPKAFSNYDRTNFSLASSFNMQYLDTVPQRYREDSAIYDGFFAPLIHQSSVLMLLKKLGYSFVNVAAGCTTTDYIPNADVNVLRTFDNEFLTSVLLMTPLLATESYFPLLRDWYALTLDYPDKLWAEIARLPAPKFVFVHVNLPHPPFVFDAAGRHLPLSIQNASERSTSARYMAQVAYTDARVKQWVQALLSQSHGQAIIILQGDHGSWMVMPRPYASQYYNQRLRILNALYLPGGSAGAYEGISPVNTFRLILNRYFKADLPLLRDQAYCMDINQLGTAHPNGWLNVTDQIKFRPDTIKWTTITP